MSDNQLVPAKKNLPALLKKDSVTFYTPVVSY